MSEERDRLCNLCRFRLAECELDGEPLCIACADLAVERIVAFELSPEAVRRLPSLEELVGR